MNAHNKQMLGNQSKFYQLDAHQPLPGTLASEVSPNREDIQEQIEQVIETTNGAKEMMSDTCTSFFFQPPIQGALPLHGTV